MSRYGDTVHLTRRDSREVMRSRWTAKNKKRSTAMSGLETSISQLREATVRRRAVRYAELEQE